MKVLHPQPPELCARCGEVVKDLEWVIEQEDGRVVHETWSLNGGCRPRPARQMEIAW